MNENDPIILKEACKLFPQAKLTPSTLRAEGARGRLTIFRMGKRDYTTLAFMREMVRRCQDEDCRRDSISIRTEGSGLSATDRALNAQARANETVARLIKPSLNTSGANISQNRLAHR
jgi:hypothetical protein